jgi:S-disulfanyl-L-cysteine oxidoreductase SoxD
MSMSSQSKGTSKAPPETDGAGEAGARTYVDSLSRRLHRRTPGVVVAGVLLLVAGLNPPAALAQLPTYGVGRPPTAEEVKAWDLTIPPDGQGLPQGSGTAALGKPIYAQRCASCHGEKAEDPKYRLLTGRRRTLTAAELPKNIDPLIGGEPALTIGSFWQYATTLWSYINRSQPFDEPGSLRADEVYAVTAYLLHLNGIIGENDVIDDKTLPRVKMPNRDGFIPDARPDVGKAARTPKR